MNLVIVESPAKAKTINKYLGKNYLVLASYGHVRDLPSKDGSVDPKNNFKMEWELDSFSKKYVKEITDAAADSERIILATDPDREGEAIAWHVREILESKKLLKGKKVERVVFNEITKKAVTNGINNPREIESLLVNAYMARRALDYLVGFNISPILWTKLPGSKSAGRVQSVALRLITEREHEIELFKPEEFWTIASNFENNQNNLIKSKLSVFDGEKIEKFSFKKKSDSEKTLNEIKNQSYKIADVSSKVYRRNPMAPFTTSTLQQTASGKFGFGASRTMQIAQRLYQGIDLEGDTVGLITYMRTDGTQISNEAISDFRNFIDKEHGKEYLPENPNSYTGKKAKNAQEAHEAIRPTDISKKPTDMKKYLSTDQSKLYELIWNRALSSQMNPAEFDRKSITIESENKKINFKANGSTIKFDGFLKVYKFEEKDEDLKNILPEVKIEDKVNIKELTDEQHFTDPPPRYSEASLVKKMEELGIGRPSTYASIISVLSTRNYVELLNKRFHPTDRGKLLSAFLEKLFTKYVDYNFTADLENQLDEITSGKIDWVKVLDGFWKDFYSNVGKVKEKRTREVLDLLNESLGDLVFERDDNNAIDSFHEIGTFINLYKKPSFTFKILRDSDEIILVVSPMIVVEDIYGKKRELRKIGISSFQPEIKKTNIFYSLYLGTKSTYDICSITIKALNLFIIGKGSIDDLGGPVKIAHFSGMMLEQGFLAFLNLIILLSVSIGLINLFPVPVLDGGHLLFYIFEGIIGRPINQKIQKIFFKIGFILIITFAVFLTYNDIVSLFNF